VTPLEGAVPIIADGKVIGAIGHSGAASNQDAWCAMAGAAAAVGKWPQRAFRRAALLGTTLPL
jgi:uncharacterized protein GlcG (DUF336 family)